MKPEILIIDDEEFFAETLCNFLLRHTAAHVEYACSSEEAVERFQQKNYDLVISDLHMSDELDGEAVVRLHGLNPEQAFIIVSGHEIPERIHNLKDLHLLAYLEKPFNMQVIIDEVNRKFTGMKTTKRTE
jgi:DNA-binding NtrC family response regulator